MPRHAKFAAAILLALSTESIRPALSVSARAQQESDHAALRPAAAPDIPFEDYDSQAEQTLLMLANQSRSKAAAPPLRLDAGLSRAARAHAEAMVSAHALSHQFAGEPSLAERLAAATHIQLDEAGENVAFDYDAQDGHKHLMQSPPHRANLLNASFNVVGLGVVRSGDRLYIVEDFGRALPSYSPEQARQRVAETVAQLRRQGKQPRLAENDLPAAADAACSMAHADSLNTAAIHQLARRYTLLNFTTLHPEALPAEAARAISSHNLHHFSVGTCYARTETYPTGVFWIVLALD